MVSVYGERPLPCQATALCLQPPPFPVRLPVRRERGDELNEGDASSVTFGRRGCSRSTTGNHEDARKTQRGVGFPPDHSREAAVVAQLQRSYPHSPPPS